MTEEYKNNLIKFLTGKLEEERIINEPQLTLESEVINNYETYIADYISEDFNPSGWIQDANSEKILIYGWVTSGSTITGGIVILDENLTPIQAITQFDSGTPLRGLWDIKNDESGRQYAVDNNGSQTRLILLNNIFNTNSVHLRKSYIFPNSDFKVNTRYNGGRVVKKDVDAANYLFLGYDASHNVLAINLKIEVGVSNEWTNYTSTNLAWYMDANVDWNEMGEVEGTIYNGYNTNIYLLTPSNNSLLISETLDISMYGSISQLSIYSPNIFYFMAVSPGTDETYINMVQYNTSGVFTEVMKLTINFLTNVNYVYSNFLYVDGTPFFSIRVPSTTENSVAVYEGFIDEYGVVYYQQVGTATFSNIDEFRKILIVKKAFNLIRMYTDASGEGFYSLRTIYNTSNYNGLPIENNYSLYPNSVMLYDQNSNVIFARNLYNKVVNGNTTQSVVEVPNNYLNNVTISQQDLMSYLNNTLISESRDITKNVYEKLLINYYVSIFMLDKNDPNNIKANSEAAARLNSDTTEQVVYEGTRAKKIRITYNDNTTEVKTIDDTQIVNQDNYSIYSIYLLLERSAKTLEIISYDGFMSYITIDISELSVNKIYKITQKVHIE